MNSKVKFLFPYLFISFFICLWLLSLIGSLESFCYKYVLINLIFISMVYLIDGKRIVSLFPKEKNNFLYYGNHIIHDMVIIGVLFGMFLPKNCLKYHLILYPVLMMHWISNNRRCIFGDIEWRTSGRKNWESKTILDQFYKSINLSDIRNQIHLSMFSISWLISYIRILQ